MISMARTFGAPLTVPAGNVARSTSTALASSREVAGDLAGEVHHVGVTLEHHQLFDLLGAELHHPAHVVAGEVDEHDVLGALLRVLGQLGGHAPVVALGAAPAAGPGDGTADDPAVEQLHHRLGRRADQRRLGVAHEVHVRRRVDLAQHPVHVERVGSGRRGRSAGPAPPGRCRRRGCAPGPPRPPRGTRRRAWSTCTSAARRGRSPAVATARTASGPRRLVDQRVEPRARGVVARRTRRRSPPAASRNTFSMR